MRFTSFFIFLKISFIKGEDSPVALNENERTIFSGSKFNNTLQEFEHESEAVIAARNIFLNMQKCRSVTELPSDDNIKVAAKQKLNSDQIAIFSKSSLGVQENLECGLAGSQTLFFGLDGKMVQANYAGSRLCIQKGYFHNGFAMQKNFNNSAGNIQFNIGIAGEQFVDEGYSFNLQYNLIYCETIIKDRVTTLKGNIRVEKCYGSPDDFIYHNSGDVIYKIYFPPCDTEEFLKIQDGKVFVKFCVYT
jgi:hypothetical protein